MHSSMMKLGLVSLAASAALAMPAKPLASRQDAPSKRGLCYNDPNLTNLFTGSKVTFAYNWDSQPGGSIRSGLDYNPMLFDNKNGHPEAFNANLDAAIAAGATHILGFNEPDLDTQANMDVNTSVDLWNQYIQPHGDTMTLVSPAVTNGADPMGLTWLQNFINACTGCKIDAIALHWYDSATNFDYFKNYFTNAYTQFGKPIWITEFGASGSDDEINTFLQTILPWLDEQQFIERYAYFMAGEGTLVSGGALSSYGQTYNDF